LAFGWPAIPRAGENPISLGDQLTWEQILAAFKGKERLWVISRDGDHGTVFDDKGFLNRFLYDELRKITPTAEAYLFEDLVEGIADFVSKTGVKAEKRLTPEEAKEIKREEKALPPLGWLLEESFVPLQGFIVRGPSPNSQIPIYSDEVLGFPPSPRKVGWLADPRAYGFSDPENPSGE
jgi:hypothetical protein